MHHRPSMKEQERIVASWKDIPEGTVVVVTKDTGEKVATKTRSAPWLLGGHTAVIMLEGVSGCYSLERVRRSCQG